MTKKPHILLVEDEENFGSVLKNYLELNDYLITLAGNGQQGLQQFKNDEFDLCILDVMMPVMDGFTLAGEIRKLNSSIPLLFLTAKKLKEDIITGYQIGADDYVTKPFDTEVLLYKIKAVLNRKRQIDANATADEFAIGQFHFNCTTRELVLGENTRKLSPKETALLKMLAENKNEVVPRELALIKIWQDNSYFTTRSMDVFIAKLRKYLKADPEIEIINVHGNGFRLLAK